jgi:hypothetical protein
MATPALVDPQPPVSRLVSLGAVAIQSWFGAGDFLVRARGG